MVIEGLKVEEIGQDTVTTQTYHQFSLNKKFQK